MNTLAADVVAHEIVAVYQGNADFQLSASALLSQKQARTSYSPR